MNESLRTLMRRIALGLPFAVPVALAPFNMGFGCNPCRPIERVDRVAIQAPPDGGVVDCLAVCRPEPGEHAACQVSPSDPTEVECYYDAVVCVSGGRPSPDPTRLFSTATDDPTARWLADAALLEAASVVAFDDFAWRLGELGAPASLVARARGAREDERRHAVAMARLAARRTGGAFRARVEVRRGPLGDLAALAEDNVVHGCLGEGWAALEATVQAARAPDPELRAAMSTIAREEAEHAQLADDVQRWVAPRLSRAERDRVEAAAEEARRAHRRTLQERAHPPDLGLMPAHEATRRFDAIFA